MCATTAKFRPIRLIFEQLGDRNLPSAIGASVLAAPLPIGQSNTAHQAVLPPVVPPGPGPLLVASTSPSNGTPGPATAPIAVGGESSIEPASVLSAQAIAARSALSSSHQVGVENDLSPLAEAPEGIAVWDTADPFARPR
jgi:hypothetical protein